MNLRAMRIFLIVAMISTFPRIDHALHADEASIRRFESEYPIASKSLAERFGRCQGQFRLEWDENGKRMGLDVDFFRSHGFDKVEIKTSGIVGGKKLSTTDVQCFDDTTSFQVFKLDDQPKWTLNKSNSNMLEREAFETLHGRIIRAPLGGVGKSLAAMMEEGTIEIEDAQVVAERPAEIEVTFRVDDESPLERIVATFDTSNSWAVTRQTTALGSPLRTLSDYRVEYAARMTDGVRLPFRVRVEQHDSPYEFRKWTFGEVPREQFLLPYYGLPDVISDRNRKRFGWFEWAVLAGVIAAIILGFLILRLSKRRDKVLSTGA